MGNLSRRVFFRLQFSIGVSPLLPFPFTHTFPGEGVLRGQQLRTLCLETELEFSQVPKRKRCVCPCLFPLVRRTELGPVLKVCKVCGLCCRDVSQGLLCR